MKRSLILIIVLVVVGAGAGLFIATHVSQKVASDKLRAEMVAAEKLLKEGNASAAAKVLAPWRSDPPGGMLGEQYLTLSMRALEQSGESLDAMAVAEVYLKEYPKGEARADAEFILLQPLIETDPGDSKVRAAADEFLTKYPEHAASARLQVALARAEAEKGNRAAARERLLALVEKDIPAAEKQQAVELLGKINLALLMTPEPQSGETVIELKQGQYLYDLARKHKVPLELVMAVNQITDARRLQIGQRIRIPNVQFSLVCDKTENTLTVYNHGEFFCQYPVRTGRNATSTPTGEFKILNKKTDPTWRSPIDGKTYKPGDPNNELGTRWMAFEGDILGIHGTIHPDTVGHYASNGCIGMLMSDVEELFDLIPVGTPLRIVGTQDITKHRVINDPTEVASKP